MRVTRSARFVALILGVGSLNAMAVEEAAFSVVERDGRFEIRDYAPQVLAETRVDASLEEAGNRAFKRLFQYISGANTVRTNLSMTAPVAQKPTSVKIPMTSPVGQVATGTQWAVSFMMPSGQTLDTLPIPDDPTIVLREVPARRMAAVRYSGTWSERGFAQNLAALEAWISRKGLRATGDPVWARYNPPFTPWFWRRNEVLLPLAPPD